MTRIRPLLAAVLALVPIAPTAQAAPQDLDTAPATAPVLPDDGPWIELPAGYIVDDTAPTAEDIVAMADLDGNPSVVTAQEREMIEVLSQVLLGSPLAD